MSLAGQLWGQTSLAGSFDRLVTLLAQVFQALENHPLAGSALFALSVRIFPRPAGYS
jgi:hypothetical protein